MIGHADTAADVATKIALGSLDLEFPGHEWCGPGAVVPSTPSRSAGESRAWGCREDLLAVAAVPMISPRMRASPCWNKSPRNPETPSWTCETEMRAFRGDMQSIRAEVTAAVGGLRHQIADDMRELRKDVRSDYRWLLGVIPGGFAAGFALLSHGFHWF